MSPLIVWLDVQFCFFTQYHTALKCFLVIVKNYSYNSQNMGFLNLLQFTGFSHNLSCAVSSCLTLRALLGSLFTIPSQQPT